MSERISLLADIDAGLDIDDWFPKEVGDVLRFHSTRFGVPNTYMAMPFLVTSSYLSQHTMSVYTYRDISTQKEIEVHAEPTILYSMVVGESGSNKTACTNFFIDMLDDIENIYGAEHMYETGTLDGLVKTLLRNDNTAVGLYDEICTFNDGMDKGNTGSFDRSVYLSLYNAKKFLKATKTSGDVSMKSPRFSLFTFTQESPIKKFIIENMDNGFFQRFLLSYPPEKTVMMAEKKRLLMIENEIIDLKKIFRKIYKRCASSVSQSNDGDVENTLRSVRLELDDEAVLVYDVYYDDFQKKKGEYDGIERSIRSKSIARLLRLAGVSNLIRNAVEEVKSTEDDFIPDNIINKTDINRALVIVRYGVESSIVMARSVGGKDNSNKVGKRDYREFIPIPEVENMSMDYLLENIRHTRNILSKEKVEMSKVTRDKMYPHTSSSKTQGAIYGYKFVQGIIAVGLGELQGTGKQRVFHRFTPDNDDLRKKWNTLGIHE